MSDMSSWDQADYVSRCESLQVECTELEARLTAAGETPEARPAIVHTDIVATVEALESFVPKLRVMTDLAERRTRVAARPLAKLAAGTAPSTQAKVIPGLTAKAPSTPQKPRAMTLTEQCRVAVQARKANLKK